MMFPQYYNFPGRRLKYHVIRSTNVKNLDDCVLFCYLNDNCLSLNFKKNAGLGGIGYICEANNATHLEYDIDLIDNGVFYYHGSKVSNWLLKFRNVPFWSFCVGFNTLVI